jgi:hypothetical protein
VTPSTCRRSRRSRPYARTRCGYSTPWPSTPRRAAPRASGPPRVSSTRRPRPLKPRPPTAGPPRSRTRREPARRRPARRVLPHRSDPVGQSIMARLAALHLALILTVVFPSFIGPREKAWVSILSLTRKTAGIVGDQLLGPLQREGGILGRYLQRTPKPTPERMVISPPRRAPVATDACGVERPWPTGVASPFGALEARRALPAHPR